MTGLSEQIDHRVDEQRFVLPAGSSQAVLAYRLSPPSPDGAPRSVNFIHTYVPPEQRGQGLAEALVRHGLKWARDEGYPIQASCWYVAKFLRQTTAD